MKYHDQNATHESYESTNQLLVFTRALSTSDDITIITNLWLLRGSFFYSRGFQRGSIFFKTKLNQTVYTRNINHAKHDLVQDGIHLLLTMDTNHLCNLWDVIKQIVLSIALSKHLCIKKC